MHLLLQGFNALCFWQKKLEDRAIDIPKSIDDVTCDVMPGRMRMHRSNINCCFARQFAHASRWSGHVLLKLPLQYTGYM